MPRGRGFVAPVRSGAARPDAERLGRSAAIDGGARGGVPTNTRRGGHGRRRAPVRCDNGGMSIDDLRRDQVIDAELPGARLRLHATWGLFSPRAVDTGSRLLLEHLDVREDEIALDLGCGYGPLGLAIARQASSGRVHLVDRDFVAVDYARENAARNGLGNVEAYLSNGFDAVAADLPLTLVVSNLPAKVGNELFRLLFHDAHARMVPGARIVVVTINGLREFVKREFTTTFGNCRKLKQGKSYTVSMAVREP